MKLKKDRGRFTVRFDMENPDHVCAVEYLERQRDRGKAQYLADAILCYEKAETKSFPQTDRAWIEQINNRLLCELATHKDFIKFLADIEIYVDGIATMQIQNLNALVDTVRHEIIERYRPGEDDPHLKVLQAAHISDDEYFSHMVLDDLNLIIRDIREAHKKDSESAPQTTVANELKENLEAVENFKGSRLEKLAVLYCKQLGINYKNLSDEEFRWLIRILQKSKKTGTPINQRKKR